MSPASGDAADGQPACCLGTTERRPKYFCPKIKLHKFSYRAHNTMLQISLIKLSCNSFWPLRPATVCSSLLPGPLECYRARRHQESRAAAAYIFGGPPLASSVSFHPRHMETRHKSTVICAGIATLLHATCYMLHCYMLHCALVVSNINFICQVTTP